MANEPQGEKEIYNKHMFAVYNSLVRTGSVLW